jgi:hypothetical protein
MTNQAYHSLSEPAPLPDGRPACRLCGAAPRLAGDPFNSGLCFACYCDMRAQIAAIWAEREAEEQRQACDAAEALIDAAACIQEVTGW